MPLNVLIVPDKFKGTLTAAAATQAIARGWRKSRPDDQLDLLPMSDGGDGFGEVVSTLLDARLQSVRTVNAAHRPCKAAWWWEPKCRFAIIESAKVVGLAMLPPGEFHPFKLDTFGLGAVLRAAQSKGAKQILIGIGGSATNDGGFGLARALGWEFLNRHGQPIHEWTGLKELASICPPSSGARASESAQSNSGEGRHRSLGADMAVRVPGKFGGASFGRVTVAVDVQNRLLGARGATRVYGPQKGIRPADFDLAERCLRRLARVVKQLFGEDFAAVPGAGAAGGLGFGLLTFLGAKAEPGFELFAKLAKLEARLRKANLVITAEGAIDHSTLMGKGVGQVAQRCRALNLPCLGFGGVLAPESRRSKLFTRVAALTDLTDVEQAKAKPARWLARLAQEAADRWSAAD
ncbi:MAG: glycerate kinase [Verrucomicrobia bacterium]|nr:glycerate kinase [Verrucomicrobiota bacterium]